MYWQPMSPYVARIVARVREAEDDRQGSVLSLVTAPAIYSLLLPLLLLDLWVWTYQWICFPIYGIARVPRGAYFVIDRRRLAYLNGIEKVNCTVCSYANGLLACRRTRAPRRR
jgi:hypothetical protein